MNRVIMMIFCFILLGTNAQAAGKGIHYEVKIEGVRDKALLNDIRSISDTVKLKKKRPETLSLLQSRMQNDKPNINEVLRSYGYYEAAIDTYLQPKKKNINAIFKITPGPLYTLNDFHIEGLPGITLPSFSDLGLTKGQPAKAATILKARDKLLLAIQKQGYALTVIDQPTAIVDHLTHTVTVNFKGTSGEIMTFCKTEIHGLETVHESFIRNKIPWLQDERYSPDLVTKMEKRLSDTGLFSVSTIDKKQEDHSHCLDMIITVKERLKRTVKTGLDYSTDEKFGVLLSWERRNLWIDGADLTVKAKVSAVSKTGGIVYKIPDFEHLDQSLRIGSELTYETNVSYTSSQLTNSVALERKMSDYLTLGLGTEYELSYVNQIGENKDYALVGFPAYAYDDHRDNIYDPMHGGNYNITVTPYIDTLADHSDFIKIYANMTQYLTIFNQPSIVLAGRAAAGTIQGTTVSAVPPPDRFFAGGSGSVRGYSYKSLSPLVDGTPYGGDSLVEMSGELRARVSDSIGLVTFLDAGNSFANAIPDLSGTLRFGTGVGIRYYTLIAPIRFDIGIPLSKTANDPAPYQLYFSLGQAF